MSFLQPFLLIALPLIALPVIIHLINQRRYQTMRWAAMMFLLAANRMSRGYARLRQWLILLFRMVVIAALDPRRQPTAGQRLGRAGGRWQSRHHADPSSTAPPACSKRSRRHRLETAKPRGKARQRFAHASARPVGY